MDSSRSGLITRRVALRALGLGGAAAVAAACAPTASPPQPTVAPKPTSAPAPAAAPTSAPAGKPAAPAATTPAIAGISDADWNSLVVSAKQEGKFAVATYAGSGYRKVVEAFGEAFPGITIEQSQFQSSSRDFTPRLLQEMKAGLRSWDVAIMPPQEQLRQTRPSGGLDPIRPAIVRADVLSDASWIDGFEAGFPDIDKKWGYGITLSKSQALWINSDMVKDGEITKVQDLLDPKWKGKIIAADPRTKGSGFSPALVMRLRTGNDDIIKQLFKDQEVQLTTDARQPTELMVRGRFPIALGAIDRHILADFRAEGQGLNLKPIPLQDIEYVSHSFNAMWLLKDAPHPNAAKVFINWALGKEAGALWATNLEDNSRRADVPVFEPITAIAKGETFVNVQREDMLEETEVTQKIAQEVLN